MSFVNARTNAVMTLDPRVALMNYLKSNWTATPAADEIKFDTKFGAYKENMVVVEKMPTMMEYQVLGASRTHFQDTFRVQIACFGHSAINNAWLIQQEIQRIINGNALGIQNVTISGMSTATGIDWAEIEQFTEISTYSDALITRGEMPKEPSTRARSYAVVHCYYDKVVV